jgi:hypothetical protein
MKHLLFGFALVLATGCATTRPPAFISKERLAFDATKYPDDAAIVLHREDRTELVDDGSEAYTRNLRHEVFAIQGEGGFWLAEVKVPVWSKSKLLHFIARVVQPDGTEQTFDGSSMLSDANGKGESDLNAKFFRFPDVRVGSLLEYAWEVEYENYWTADDQDTLGRWPVRHYEFELTAPKPLVLETIAFNSQTSIDVRTLGDGRHQLKFELNDLPPSNDADFAPHWTFTEPRWAWRVLGYRTRAFSRDWLRNWEDVVEGKGNQFFVERPMDKGLDLKLDFTGCADVGCKVQRAVAYLADKTTSTGVKWNRQEVLASALTSGRMSAVERALLLRWLLEKEGLEVWLAYGTGRYTQQTSPTFPRSAQFDQLFVHLPVQAGIERPTTIDASCVACSFGQLPERFAGTQVFVFKTVPELSQVKTTGRWITAMEDEPPRARMQLTHQVKLEADGTLRDDAVVRWQGTAADGTRATRAATPEKKVRSGELETLRRASPVADIDSLSWDTCDQTGCGWKWTGRLPGEAQADGPRWLVPTSLLRPVWDEVFQSPKRDFDVQFVDPLEVEEVASVKVPDGLRLVDVPAPVKLDMPGFSVEVSVERTPDGAKVRRLLKHDQGVIAKADYARLRALVEAFRRARREVLVFAPK